jgi:hypothetical protein
MFGEYFIFGDLFTQVGAIFSQIWFLVLPTFFWFLFKSLWSRHAGNGWLALQNDIFLEIIPPREIEKSPKIMESFFNALAATDAGMNKFAEYALGKMNPYFSLEIAGIEGKAHFYIRTPAGFRELVESGLYAQYPDLEIIQVDDYTQNVPANIPNEEWTLWGADWTLLQPDAFPIKTYKYFDEDITGKMIDPLANYLEIISALGPDQQVWIQYIIQMDRPGWKTWGKEQIDEFLGNTVNAPGFGTRLWHDIKDIFKNIPKALFGQPEMKGLEAPTPNEIPVMQRLTPGEQKTLTAMEEKIEKNIFTTKFRMIIVGKKANFNGVNIAGIVSMLKEFSDTSTNEFMPVDRTKTYADYINTEARKAVRMRRILERYRERDDVGETFKFSTTELATVFHMPDMSVISPSVQFTENKFGTAPINLPVE